MSAGLLLFRRTGGSGGAGFEVLIVLPGGPLYARRDEGWWSLPKGEHGPGEEALSAARREFAEELGSDPPDGEQIDLGSVTQAGGKLVRAWAVEGELDVSAVVSNDFEMEWPPRTGSFRRFPEISRAEWVSPMEARRKLLPAQAAFVDRLEAALQTPGELRA